MTTNYFLSEQVKVYPSTYRGYVPTESGTDPTDVPTFDPEARLLTEYNFVNLPGLNLIQPSYIASVTGAEDITSAADTGATIICVVGGYYFEISNLKLPIISAGIDYYLSIKLGRSVLETGEAGGAEYSRNTWNLVSYSSSSSSLNYNLDQRNAEEVYEFTGLALIQQDSSASALGDAIHGDVKTYYLKLGSSVTDTADDTGATIKFTFNQKAFLPHIYHGNTEGSVEMLGDITSEGNLTVKGDITSSEGELIASTLNTNLLKAKDGSLKIEAENKSLEIEADNITLDSEDNLTIKGDIISSEGELIASTLNTNLLKAKDGSLKIEAKNKSLEIEADNITLSPEGNLNVTGNIISGNITSKGALTVESITAPDGTSSGGNLSVAGDITASTLNTNLLKAKDGSLKIEAENKSLEMEANNLTLNLDTALAIPVENEASTTPEKYSIKVVKSSNNWELTEDDKNKIVIVLANS